MKPLRTLLRPCDWIRKWRKPRTTGPMHWRHRGVCTRQLIISRRRFGSSPTSSKPASMSREYANNSAKHASRSSNPTPYIKRRRERSLRSKISAEIPKPPLEQHVHDFGLSTVEGEYRSGGESDL